MSKTGEGTEYEKFVQGIYTTLMNAEGVQNVAVEHNKVVGGKSGCDHQIDVYWEFKVAGQTYRTAIECKHFQENVPIGRVRDFYGVLADVPGLQGIFISLNGFQSGARQYAAHYGIRLQEIRPPNEEDWAGRVKDIFLNIVVIMPDIKQITPNVTAAFRATILPGQQIVAQFAGTNQESLIVDANGAHVASHEEIRGSLPHKSKSEQGCAITIPYPGCFFRSQPTILPIDSITLQYDVGVETIQVDIRGAEIAKAIMKDVATGDIAFFTKDGRVQQVRK